MRSASPDLLSLTTTISPELAKHFVFSGTKIVRVRRGPEKDAGVATAMVVRTGFNTTKGALIRSMLFPRPNKFRFYRDSFRFIGVMAVIAMMGFCVSIVNFLKLGVRCLYVVLTSHIFIFLYSCTSWTLSIPRPFTLCVCFCRIWTRVKVWCI